ADTNAVFGRSAAEHRRGQDEHHRLDLDAPVSHATGVLDRVAEELAHRVPFRPNPERGRQYEPGTGKAFVVAVALQHRDRLARQLFLLLRSRLTPQGRDERELEPRSNLQVLTAERVRLCQRLVEDELTPLEIVAGVGKAAAEI